MQPPPSASPAGGQSGPWFPACSLPHGFYSAERCSHGSRPSRVRGGGWRGEPRVNAQRRAARGPPLSSRPGSGEVLERGPHLRPGRLQPAHQVDRGTLLIVADTEPVVERGDLPDAGELALEEGRIHAHGDGRTVLGRWRPPEPEAVHAAVHLRQAETAAVA